METESTLLRKLKKGLREKSWKIMFIKITVKILSKSSEI